MSFDRTSLLRGPAKVLLAGSANLFAEGTIKAAFETEREDRGVDAFGTLTRPIKDKMVKVSLTPSQWDNLAALFPYASTALGSSVFGAVDTELVVTPVNGGVVTLANAAITKMPGIRLAAIGSQFSGDLEITGLIANSSSPTATASYYSLGAATTGNALTGLDATKLLNGAYTATYNGQTLYAEDAFEISFDLSLDAQSIDGHGTVDMFLASLDVTCKFKPTGNTEAEMLALRNWATAIGSEPARYPLVISGGSGKPKVTLNNCEVNPSEFVYGASENRNGEIEFKTCRTVSAGALDPVFVVETEA